MKAELFRDETVFEMTQTTKIREVFILLFVWITHMFPVLLFEKKYSLKKVF